MTNASLICKKAITTHRYAFVYLKWPRLKTSARIWPVSELLISWVSASDSVTAGAMAAHLFISSCCVPSPLLLHRDCVAYLASVAMHVYSCLIIGRKTRGPPPDDIGRVECGILHRMYCCMVCSASTNTSQPHCINTRLCTML